KSLKDGKWYNTTASGYNTATMSIEVTAARDGMEFRCKVTDAYGNTAISDPAALHMAAVLEITSQPADFTGPLGATASFTVTASGDGLTYQWQYKSLKDGKWYNTTASGYNTATMSIQVTTARDGMEFRCKVTDAYGNTLTSEPAALHVATDPLIREFRFETDPAAEGWSFVDADGDGFNWEWTQGNDANLEAYEGEYFICSKSYDNGTSAALTPDNWAVSPAIDLSGVTGPVSLSFYAKGQDPAYPAEHFAVYVGTSADIGAMDMVVAESVANAPWQQYTADLSAYAGQSQVYVAIRHFNCTDMFMLDVDWVQILRGTV
ncbi:MAG: choice-of-anchor J domain-containing protein, partial [Oscillospiraceae bacterium]|nr:choice-of-anchor J domain-containing protein [Oscillospiraceae bacterium]